MCAESLKEAFFERDSFEVAEALIGCRLCRKSSDQVIAKYTISEIEVYDGFEDRASHAFKGKTKRNSVMFGPAGRLYVYLCYGKHWMLNITTQRDGYPAAILIRALSECEGPGRLTKRLSIDGGFNDLVANNNNSIWFENRASQTVQFKKMPRVGVAYSGPVWSEKPFRYCLDS